MPLDHAHHPELEQSEPEAGPARWLEEHGDALWAFAIGRVRRAELAEEALQETFVAALGARAEFRGEASERTWLVAILKRKLVDVVRRASREGRIASGVWHEAFGSMYTGAGMWAARLAQPRVRTGEERRELARDLQRCLDELPGPTRETFVLRQVQSVPAESVCDQLGISPENLWARMHRARMLLRRCLSARWWPDAAGTCEPRPPAEHPEPLVQQELTT